MGCILLLHSAPSLLFSALSWISPSCRTVGLDPSVASQDPLDASAAAAADDAAHHDRTPLCFPTAQHLRATWEIQHADGLSLPPAVDVWSSATPRLQPTPSASPKPIMPSDAEALAGQPRQSVLVDGCEMDGVRKATVSPMHARPPAPKASQSAQSLIGPKAADSGGFDRALAAAALQ